MTKNDIITLAAKDNLVRTFKHLLITIPIDTWDILLEAQIQSIQNYSEETTQRMIERYETN